MISRLTRKSVNAFGLLVIVGAVLSFTTGCVKDSTADPRNLTPMVSIEGSDTMSVLLKQWAEAFMKDNADIPVSVTIADSGAGLKALLDKSTDIAASSRDLTNEENENVHEKGLHLVRRIVALDSIAVVVNPEFALNEIAMPELRKVFTGATTKWSDLDSKLTGSIMVCVREPESGTAHYFTEHALKAPNSPKSAPAGVYARNAKVLNSNDALIDVVAANKNAIGFIPFSNAIDSKDKVKTLKVKLLDSSPDAVMPTLAATTDDYSLSRPLYMFFDSKSKPQTRKFVDFCLSEKGQEIVKANGFVKLK
jgi:phosphate transport system substrate-binding protein